MAAALPDFSIGSSDPAAGCSDVGCADSGTNWGSVAGCGIEPGIANGSFGGGLFGNGCGTAPCDGGCGGSCNLCCSMPVWQHRTGLFGEYLYLRPRDAEVAYAVPIDGPIVPPPAANPIQVGSIGVVDPGYQSGFRAGLQVALTECSSVDVAYTQFSSSASDQIGTDAAQVLRSLVAHPSSASAATDWLDASAQYDIDFELFDVAYRKLLWGGDLHAVNYLVGGRYGKLVQDFRSTFTANGSETVMSRIEFEGGGVRLGLDGKRFACSRRLHVYGTGHASFLAGQFESSYAQGQAFDPSVVDTGWEAGRIVSILDLEAGIGWMNTSGSLRVSAGYMVSAWFNTLKVNHLIDAVQQNQFLDMEDTFTFDGLVVRGELRF